MDRRILVVDDNEPLCHQISQFLARPDRRIKVAHDATTALEWLVDGNFSLVVTDLALRKGEIGGLEIIREIQQRELPVTSIVMTGYDSIASAVEAIQLGAYDYFRKPVDFEALDMRVEQALADRRLRDEVAELRGGLRQRFGLENLVGKSARIREVFDKIARLAPSNETVLITGETGTGKEPVAQALHHLGGSTRQGRLVVIPCAAIPETLIESELFGHEAGAFTGADRRKPGRFELAHQGTLFLDEIGELPLPTQAKLLRVLQDGSFERVGGRESIRVETRVVAATNQDLKTMVAEGRFREDLYYRLNVVSIELPPLRDRIEDLPLLVNHFLKRLQERRYPAKTFAREALARLSRHAWPGNVRELEHLVEQLVVTSPGTIIEPDHLPRSIVATCEEPLSLDFDIDRPLQDITDQLTERIERAYLSRVLERHHGRIDRCAAHCGLSRRSISEKLRRYRIDKAEFKTRSTRRAVPADGASAQR